MPWYSLPPRPYRGKKQSDETDRLSSLLQGHYPVPVKENVIPASDGAGVVEEIGARVSRFKKGDKVTTLFTQAHIAGRLTPEIRITQTGGFLDGVLRKYGTFDEHSLVAMPKTLDFQQASTLSCAATTAWNSLYGLEGRALKPGDVVLTQGTGGVSIFALQVCSRRKPPYHDIRS